MKKIIFVSVLICILALGTNSAKADFWTFATIPADGVIGGAPEKPIGWGYTISNLSNNNWLELTVLDAGPFENATILTTSLGDILFDFPILGPNTTVTVMFDPVALVGLYGITWETTATPGFENVGTFTLSAEWYDGDPLIVGSIDLGLAPVSSVSYTATVTSPVPEPATLVLMGFGSSFMGIGIKRLRKKSRKTK
jgi:hypothetical protein